MFLLKMSDTDYIEYDFTIAPLQPGSEILMAELGELEFESFVEDDSGLQAYIKKEYWNPDIIKKVRILSNPEFEIKFSIKEVEPRNWNATWEQDFMPIQIGSQCVVRAPFHPQAQVAYDIVIAPKMSFGTGHHETTQMMLQHVLNRDVAGKSVLDMGCGTGVLAILAAMKGASPVDAIDIDPWSYVNARENVLRNAQDHIRVLEGDSSILPDQTYTIILANINRNILLEDIPVYAQHLNPAGTLILSGFYLKDLPLISEKCAQNGLLLQEELEQNNWVAAVFKLP